MQFTRVSQLLLAGHALLLGGLGLGSALTQGCAKTVTTQTPQALPAPAGPVESAESRPQTPSSTRAALSSPLPQPAPAAARLALTFDDLPEHGPIPEGKTVVDVHQQILDVLKAHNIQGVYGFINGEKVDRVPGGMEVLTRWRDAGHLLGNHTWQHSDLDRVGPEAFIREIEQNDQLLAQLVGDTEAARRSRRVFRHPYLHQGATADVQNPVRDYLNEHQYRLAEVTVDFGDWAYNSAYTRCLSANRPSAIDALRWDFLARSQSVWLWSQSTAQRLFGRPIPHVLLLHSGSFDALVLDEMLTRYEKRGVQWISLDEALSDPAYAERRVPREKTGTLFEQIAAQEHRDDLGFELLPSNLIGQLCQ